MQMIAGHFHRSPKASAKLREKQQLLGLPVHKVLNDCITRWESTLAMLKRFIEQHQAICLVFLENRDARQFMPSNDEISAVEELVGVLDVFITLTTGNNLGWIRPQCEIIESRTNAYRGFFSRLLYVVRACYLLVSSVKTNVSLPINQWCFL